MFKAFKAWFSLLVVVWPSSIENGLLVCGARGKYGWCVISWRPSLLVFRRFLRSFDWSCDAASTREMSCGTGLLGMDGGSFLRIAFFHNL